MSYMGVYGEQPFELNIQWIRKQIQLNTIWLFLWVMTMIIYVYESYDRLC